MPVFTYTGRNASGQRVEGRMESVNSNAVADQLFGSGVVPIDILPVGGGSDAGIGGTIRAWWGNFAGEKIGLIELMLFSRQMYTLMKAGVPMLRALGGLKESTQNRAFARLLQDLRDSLDAGRELFASLHRHPKIFSPFYVSMVRVGEMTGGLEEIFLRLSYHMEFEHDMRQRIKSALRYPTFVVIAMGVAIVVINLFVIPAFAKVYAGFKAELPLMTKVLIGFSNFMVQSWPLLLAMLVGAIIGFRLYVATTPGRYRWDKYKLRIPIAGKIILKATLARFARSFALAYKSGVPIVQSMTVVAQVVDNAYIAERIDNMREGVERGESILRTALASGVFTPVVLQMIAVGEETGELDSLMAEVAGMYEREVEYEVRTLSAQVEPILIIGLAILVLILALGVFLPIWDLGKAAIK